MRNLTPSHAMARKGRRLMISGGVVGLAGLLLIALAILLFVVPVFRADWYEVARAVILIVGGILCLVGLGLILRGVLLPKDNPHARRMADYLARFLDYRYTFIRNISKRELGYVDAVLIGPNGVLVFYFLDKRGAFHSQGNAWFSVVNGQFRPAGVNPTLEAAKDVRALRRFLAQRNLELVPVYAVIVAAYPDMHLSVQQPVIPVSHMADVHVVLRDNYLAQIRVQPELVQQTVRTIMDELA